MLGERHVDLGGFQFRRHHDPQLLEERNTVGMAHQGTTGCIEVRAPPWSARHVLLDTRGIAIHALHFALQRMKIRERYVTGAATYIGRVGQGASDVIERWRHAALLGQRRFDDIGGRVEITLRVAADQRFVGGEGDVALQDAGAALSACDIRL